MTVVYATPDELEALSMGEQIAVLRDGRAVDPGSPDDLYETPVDRYVAGKIGSPHVNIFDVKVAGDGMSLETPFGPLRPSRLTEPIEPQWGLVEHLACGRPTCASRKARPQYRPPRRRL